VPLPNVLIVVDTGGALLQFFKLRAASRPPAGIPSMSMKNCLYRRHFRSVLLMFFLITSPGVSQGRVDPLEETKAFARASGIRDPEKRIGALREFLKEHPSSSRRARVHLMILETLVRHYPEDTREIGNAIDLLVGPLQGREPGPCSVVARTLSEAGILLEEAEHYGRQAVELMTIERTRQSHLESGRPLPSEELIERQYRHTRAVYQANLARVLIRKGDRAQARELLEAALESNPILPPEYAFLLARMRIESGEKALALETMMRAAVTGRLEAEQTSLLKTVYTELHGSLERLPESLDEIYEQRFPLPVNPRPYQPGPDRRDRVVLAEVFTGAGCPPCVAPDLAFEAALGSYSRGELVVLMYHQHIPLPDPMTNPVAELRLRYYGIKVVPMVLVDGKLEDKGGGSRYQAAAAYERLEKYVNRQLETPARANIDLVAVRKQGTVEAAVEIRALNPAPQKTRLHLVLVENRLRYAGENGVRFHPMVVRAMAEQGSGISIDLRKPQKIKRKFHVRAIASELKRYLDDYEAGGRHGVMSFSEKKHLINEERLSIVAFLQDEETREVLQAAFVQVKDN
jgi:tetratricopeptide (TPR) repeat protein